MRAFPTAELVADREASLKDIRICQMALALGITTYGAGQRVQERLDANQRIVDAIEAELARRTACKTPNPD